MTTILVNILLAMCSALDVAILVGVIQTIIRDHKSEKRDAERDARDKEYHELRMKEFSK